MESPEQRMTRFVLNPPIELFGTILNSVANFTLPELQAAVRCQLYTLAFLGTHAVMQTIGEIVYGWRGRKATSCYLRTFVDRNTADTQFSSIADELHELRNGYAHRWSSKQHHAFSFDANGTKGWWRQDGVLHVNPDVFIACFASGFRRDGPVWAQLLSLHELTATRRKYAYLKKWLSLDPQSKVGKEIDKLVKEETLAGLRARESCIQEQILALVRRSERTSTDSARHSRGENSNSRLRNRRGTLYPPPPSYTI